MSAYPSGAITLSNASQQNDGYGAQIQRVLSIKALADSLNIGFKLQLIKQVERQITQKNLQEEEQVLEIANFNRFLAAILEDSSKRTVPIASQHIAKTLPHLFLILLVNLPPALLRKKTIEVKIENAYKFVQYNSDLYANLKYNANAIAKKRSKNIADINVHLRFVNFANNTERYLDPDYYFKNLDHVTEKLSKLDIPYTIHLHSDFAEILPTSNHLGISQSTLEYLTEIGVTDQGGIVNLDTLNRAINCKNQIKRKYSNVIEFQNDDPLSSLIAMANSNYLILSKSSFAFVAGILNKNGRVASPFYWNHPLSAWNDKGVFCD
jgi:hypothetical protein